MSSHGLNSEHSNILSKDCMYLSIALAPSLFDLKQNISNIKPKVPIKGVFEHISLICIELLSFLTEF